MEIVDFLSHVPRCHFLGEMQIFLMELGIRVSIDASFFFFRRQMSVCTRDGCSVTSYFNEINLYLQLAVI